MQIFFTDAFTFMSNLQSFYDACAAPVWVKLNDHAVADQHFYAVQAHLSCKIRENNFLGWNLHAKECIRESLIDNSFNNLWF